LSTIGSDILKATQLLKASNVVCIPTETVYGLAANAYDRIAVKKIFQIKNRPYYDPIIVHAPSLEAVNEFVTHIPDLAIEVATKFWPGPLTMLLPKNNKIPEIVTSSLPLVGVRIPNHQTTLELLNNLDFPLAAPSANTFNYISPTKPEHIVKNLGEKIPYILDGGTCRLGMESTIIGFDLNTIVVYRLGAITIDNIKNELRDQRIQVKLYTNTKITPGSFSKHYSPKTPILLTTDIEGDIHTHKGKKVGALTFNNNLKNHQLYAKRVLTESGDLNEAAKNLYSHLIDLDNSNVDLILASYVPNIGIGSTINDRLSRAASN
jgi:L-threonylcarbamoyladenylate synthase